MVTGDDLVAVHLHGLPLAVHARSAEHSAELQREFALLLAQAEDEREGHSVPARLLTLIEELTARFSGFTSETAAELDRALASGGDEIDLVYRVPRDLGPAVIRLSELLDDADAYCEAGDHLLTLKTPEELVRYRRWFLDQFVAQAAGAEPVRWADYSG